MNSLPRQILIALAVIFSCLASPAFARDCEKDAENMSQVYSCLYDSSQQRLDAAYSDTLRVIRNRDKNAADLLVTAEESWTKFASDSCAYTAAVSREEMHSAAQSNCWATFVDARIKVLEGYRRALTSPPTK
jgi:uncharacterized protein YecT (DUF1311 family)